METEEVKEAPAPPDYRAGYVALVGEPNVGKSTLLNALVRQKLAIVTRKPQTTRHRILGILSGTGYQALLYDTPGLIEPHYLLQEKMMRFADSALADADVVLMLVDCWKAGREMLLPDNHVLLKIKQAGKKTILVLNKIDTVDAHEVQSLSEKMKALFQFDAVLPISALKNEGTAELLAAMVRCLPLHPPFYPEEMLSEAPEKFFVSEIIREKIFELYSDELPYSTTVEIIAFDEHPSKKHFIGADIVVERQSQKGIVIGKGGAALKRVGSAARAEIEKFLDHAVFLELHVKVREHWRKDRDWLRRYGYGE